MKTTRNNLNQKKPQHKRQPSFFPKIPFPSLPQTNDVKIDNLTILHKAEQSSDTKSNRKIPFPLLDHKLNSALFENQNSNPVSFENISSNYKRRKAIIIESIDDIESESLSNELSKHKHSECFKKKLKTKSH